VLLLAGPLLHCALRHMPCCLSAFSTPETVHTASFLSCLTCVQTCLQVGLKLLDADALGHVCCCLVCVRPVLPVPAVTRTANCDRLHAYMVLSCRRELCIAHCSLLLHCNLVCSTVTFRALCVPHWHSPLLVLAWLRHRAAHILLCCCCPVIHFGALRLPAGLHLSETW
jgi:hypothetical protein